MDDDGVHRLVPPRDAQQKIEYRQWGVVALTLLPV